MAKVKKYLDRVLEIENKDEKTLRIEELEDRRKRFLIDYKSQVTTLEGSVIPLLKLDGETADRNIMEAEGNVEKANFAIIFIDSSEEFELNICNAENNLANRTHVKNSILSFIKDNEELVIKLKSRITLLEN